MQHRRQRFRTKGENQIGENQIGERCHENASDCLRLDRCGVANGDTSTCLLLTRLPSRRTMPGLLRSVPAILWSAPAILWSIARLRSVPAILWSALAIPRLRLALLWQIYSR